MIVPMQLYFKAASMINDEWWLTIVGGNIYIALNDRNHLYLTVVS